MDTLEGNILGRMVNASNSTLVVESQGQQFVYKPISGEKPLWDFPEGTLALRERAAFVMSELLGWGLVPETRLMNGPLGVGSVQTWVEADTTTIEVTEPNKIPDGWMRIMSGVDETGHEVTLSHANDKALSQLAVFDAVINNADRKGGHILTDDNGRHYAIDHGVAFHHETKLRTVLWGWIDEQIEPEWIADIQRVRQQLADTELTELLAPIELDALAERMDALIAEPTFPEPNAHWPAVPWPVF